MEQGNYYKQPIAGAFMDKNQEKKIPDFMVYVERGCFEMGDIFGDGEPMKSRRMKSA